MEDKTVEALAIELHQAKKTESAAKTLRIECEEAIAVLVETGENASKTVAAGADLKVTVKRSLGYKADVDAIRALDIPDDMMPITLVPAQAASYAFDQKAYEALKEENQMVFAKVAEAVAVVPRKVSVTVKLA